MSDSKESKETPSAVLASDYCYNQTYVIMKGDGDAEAKNSEEDHHEVFFKCGNWCYQGVIQFNHLKLAISELPVVIPLLQRQQGSLRYYCNSMAIPKESKFEEPLSFMSEEKEFIASEIISEHVDKELRKWSTMFSWIDDDNAATYFDLAVGDLPKSMDDIALIASKTYTRGLIIISIFHENSVYFMLQQGEGDQQLLDVRFPDVSKHGQGLQVCCYNNHIRASERLMTEVEVDLDDGSESKSGGVGSDAKLSSGNDTETPVSMTADKLFWRKLTLWHVMGNVGGESVSDSKQVTPTVKELIPKIKTVNVSSTDYQQTYCIMKSSWDRDANGNASLLSMYHDVLFRFGSWCYAGRIQLIPSLSLSDVPFVIPALRMQQSRLDFYCEAAKVPTNSPFASTLAYVQGITSAIEEIIVSSEDMLNGLIDRLSKMGLGESVQKWLEGDPENSFFEFRLAPDANLEKMFEPMELVCSKSYHASGIITITIVFQYVVYVCVLDGSNENPLLDSRFPDISGKGRGYQLAAYNEGVDGWPELRKVSVWQTTSSLEQEFRDKAAAMAAEAKVEEEKKEEEDGRDRDDDEVLAIADASAGSDAKSSGDAVKSKSAKDSDPDTVTGVEAVADHKSVTSSMNPEHSAGLTAGQASLLGRPSLGSPGSGLGSVSRPHHLPKVDGLSSKLEEMRKKLIMQSEAEDGGGDAAPWDSSGKPLKLGLPSSLSKK